MNQRTVVCGLAVVREPSAGMAASSLTEMPPAGSVVIIKEVDQRRTSQALCLVGAATFCLVAALEVALFGVVFTGGVYGSRMAWLFGVTVDGGQEKIPIGGTSTRQSRSPEVPWDGHRIPRGPWLAPRTYPPKRAPPQGAWQ